MAKQIVLIKSFFFLNTDVFQHLSQWEKSLMDFYIAHGVEMEKVRVMGAGDGELFYIVKDVSEFNKKIENKQVKKTNTPKLLEKINVEERKPHKERYKVSIGTIKEKEREKLNFSKGRYLPRNIGETPIIRYRPLK